MLTTNPENVKKCNACMHYEKKPIIELAHDKPRNTGRFREICNKLNIYKVDVLTGEQRLVIPEAKMCRAAVNLCGPNAIWWSGCIDE